VQAIADANKRALLQLGEHLIAKVCAKVEHSFRVIKCQLGYTKVRYRGLAKNTAQLHVLFALSNLWMARRLDKPAQIAQKWAIYPLLIACLLDFSKKLAFKRK